MVLTHPDHSLIHHCSLHSNQAPTGHAFHPLNVQASTWPLKQSGEGWKKGREGRWGRRADKSLPLVYHELLPKSGVVTTGTQYSSVDFCMDLWFAHDTGSNHRDWVGHAQAAPTKTGSEVQPWWKWCFDDDCHHCFSHVRCNQTAGKPVTLSFSKHVGKYCFCKNHQGAY